MDDIPELKKISKTLNFQSYSENLLSNLIISSSHPNYIDSISLKHSICILLLSMQKNKKRELRLIKDILFFDIETTGFSGETSQLYLIGCTYFDGFGWKLIQWFADTRQAEKELLDAFFEFLKRFKILIHFNGDRFDIPYLLKCCERLGLDYHFDDLISIDIFKKIKPYRKLLKLENMKQKSIEQFLGVHREDKYNGGQLIDVYREYLHTHEKFLFDLLILHNTDDLRGMPSILPILNYADLFESDFTLCSHKLYSYTDEAGYSHPFVNLLWESPYSIPIPLEYTLNPLSLELHDSYLACNLNLYEGTLKYFYPDYQNYYYLPLEDTAIHKSIGEYVDRSARKKATAKNCYCKKEGLFLPQFSSLWEPSFKEDHKSSFSYILYDDETLWADREKNSHYAHDIFTYLTGQL